jgi:predicted ATP-grasp superfamily ATP-dependent carboligase
MKRVLITGARSPAALQLIRNLAKNGFEIYVADSLNHPLSRASKYVKKYFILATPSNKTKEFIANIEKIISQNSINILIPTCEEIFFISKYKSQLMKNCQIFCDDFLKISQLHNKYEFLNMARDCPISVPETILINDLSDLDKIKNPTEKVFKPIFSRFASHTLIRPNNALLKKIITDKNFPWIAQQFISGKEYCTYTVVVDGKIQAHACYHPKYRAGLGSGIYFEIEKNDKIKNFIEQVVKKINFTGQIGFDFMINESAEIFVLECNPRATSGIHCLSPDLDWKRILSGKNIYEDEKVAEDKMIALAMLTCGLKYLKNKKSFLELYTNLLKAKDPIWDVSDIKPVFYQLVNLGEIIFRSIKYRISLKDAATADIEWNGEEM